LSALTANQKKDVNIEVEVQDAPKSEVKIEDTPKEDTTDPSKEKTEDELIDEKIASTKPYSLKESLFDGHRSSSFDVNMRYMTKTFSFFVPEIEFISDIKGLIRSVFSLNCSLERTYHFLSYLGQKISIGNTCIYCQKTFYSKEAVQSHMVLTPCLIILQP